MVPVSFFNREPLALAQALIGKVLRHRIQHPAHGPVWLSAMIIETEAYYLDEKGSHSSLGLTESRRAMFMPPGTIYMYYSRAGDSLNFSARGRGNGVLVKSGIAYTDRKSPGKTLAIMQAMNPVNGRTRSAERLCSGQTLLCRSLGLKVGEWNQQQLQRQRFMVEDVGYRPPELIQAARLGIPGGRDEHLPYRFVDAKHAVQATRNPLKDAHRVITR